MTDAQTVAAVAGFRGPKIRRRIEGKPDSPFADFYFDVNETTLTNGVIDALRQNIYYHDLLDEAAKHVIGWNYQAELVEGSDEPAVTDPDTGKEIAPARTVYRVVGVEPIPPPSDGGVESLRRVIAIEAARGVKVDDGTVAWMLSRLRGYREELPDDVLKALRLLTAGGTTKDAGTQPSPPKVPSPTNPLSGTPSTSKRRSRSTSAASVPPSG